MAQTIKRPRSLLLVLFPLLLAAAAAGATYAVLHAVASGITLPPDLAVALDATSLEATSTAALERQWIADAFPPPAATYLPSPALRFPCPQEVANAPRSLRNAVAADLASARAGDKAALQRLGTLHQENGGSWLPGLTLGVFFAQEGRLGEARTVLGEVWARGGMERAIDQALEAARQNAPRRGPDDESVRAAVHLLHAYGHVLIRSGEGGRALWQALRNPIGCSKLLALRGATDRIAGLPTWDRHQVAAPGCATAPDALNTLDLYNNLIVGYLSQPGFTDGVARRDAELARSYDEPPALNPLLAVLRGIDAAAEPDREHWLWAVSNAERLLRQRRLSGLGPLEDPRLAGNLAQLMESALPIPIAPRPQEVRDALLTATHPLAATALDGAARLPATQRPILHQGVGRLLLTEATYRNAMPVLPAPLVADLEPAQRAVAEALAFVLPLRQDPARWLQVVRGNAEDAALAAALGERDKAWRATSRQDLAAAVARQVATATREAQREGLWRARGLLAPGDPKPDALTALEKQLGVGGRLRPAVLITSPFARFLFTLLVAAIVWLLGAWLALQLRRRRELLTSFYRLEAQARLRGARR